MMEKELAYHIANSGIVQKIVDDMGGVTLGGVTISERYLEMMYKSCPNQVIEISKNANALRHWVLYAGYNPTLGVFEVCISNSIQNN